MSRGFRPVVRRPEGIRWLRSDGKPNFSNRLYRREGELEILATRPVYYVSPTTPVGEAIDTMYEKNVRVLPVAKPSDRMLEGLVTASRVVEYLGGGELHKIVVERHQGSIYGALSEPVSSIMDPHPVVATTHEKLSKVLERMVIEGVGVVVVVEPDGRLYGVITEHDIVRRLVEKKVGVTVGEVMSRNVVTINVEATLLDAARTMIKYSFRRLPVVSSEGVVKGMITAKDIIRFFGSHEAYKHAVSGRMEDAMKVSVNEVMRSDYYTISPDADVGDAATEMMDKGVSSLLVVEDDRLKGIITERDVLYALAAGR